MTAVILAGGKGTRLRPFTVTIPKPLLPLGDMPILEVVIRQLAAAGFSRVVLTLGHMAHLFTALIGDGSQWGIRVEICVEDEPLGTAGPLRLIPDLEDDFIVMNGDLLTTLDYRALVAEHVAQRAWGTIATTTRQVDIVYGVIEERPDGTLDRYNEKPTIYYAVGMGINVLSRHCLEFIPAAGRYDMPQLMTAMKDAGKRVVCRRTDCYWQDIGLFDDYERASADFAADPLRFLPASPHSGPPAPARPRNPAPTRPR
jgi:NDP-sugar pyrophosphorylase family protein